MDLIILHDGLYHLVEVTKEMTEGHVFKTCLDLCDIIREKLTVYHNEINKHGAYTKFMCVPQPII